MSIFTCLLLLFIFLLCLAIVSGAETALFSLSSLQVKSYKNDKDKRKRLIFTLLSNPRELLITLIILIIIVSVLVQNVVSNLFGEKASWGLRVGVPLALNLIIGEVIPKSLALPNNEKVSYAVAPLLYYAQKILFPLRKVLSSITFVAGRCCFFFLKKEEEISTDELQHALKTSKESGVLGQDEAELIRGYLHLQESTVKELMRPREEVIFFETEEPLHKLLHLFVDQECSRIPVCEGSLDNIIGVISSRLFFLQKLSIKQTADLIPILKKPFFIPETTSAGSLLRQLYERKESLAVVVDEYGSVSGIITLEDLVEEVVGEIADRRDEKTPYTKAGEDVIIASGKLELSEFEEIFDYELVSDNHMVTIGGWLTEQMGDIPKTGAKYMTKDFLFHVLSSDQTRVRRVYIRRITPLKKKKGGKGK